MQKRKLIEGAYYFPTANKAYSEGADGIKNMIVRVDVILSDDWNVSVTNLIFVRGVDGKAVTLKIWQTSMYPISGIGRKMSRRQLDLKRNSIPPKLIQFFGD